MTDPSQIQATTYFYDKIKVLLSIRTRMSSKRFIIIVVSVFLILTIGGHFLLVQRYDRVLSSSCSRMHGDVMFIPDCMPKKDRGNECCDDASQFIKLRKKVSKPLPYSFENVLKLFSVSQRDIVDGNHDLCEFRLNEALIENYCYCEEVQKEFPGICTS